MLKGIPNNHFVKEGIYHSIRMDIISQKLKPGQYISEDELAKQYNMSRTPIREILIRLAQEDLIRIIPNKGIFVYELTKRDMDEILEIRLILESAAAKTAAENITDEKINKLDKIENQLDIAAKEMDEV